MTPTRIVSLAPKTRVEARAVIPLAMRKERRVNMRPPVRVQDGSRFGTWNERFSWVLEFDYTGCQQVAMRTQKPADPANGDRGTLMLWRDAIVDSRDRTLPAHLRSGAETYRDLGSMTAVPVFAIAIALLSVRRRFLHITNPVSN